MAGSLKEADVCIFKHPIDCGTGQYRIAKNLRPFVDISVGSDDHGGVVLAPVEEIENLLGDVPGFFMENNGPVPTTHLERSARQSIKVIFEFSVHKPKFVIYRGVLAADGSYRMETRGLRAKKFKPFMYCGDKRGFYQQKEAIEHYFRTGPLPFTKMRGSTPE